MKRENVILVVICIVMITIGIIFIPSIYKFFNEKTLKVDDIEEVKEKKEEKEKISLDSEILKDLVYPVMHNDVGSKDSYYKLSNIKVNSFSNNDILYNAFLQIYSGYLINNNGVVSFSASYLDSRVQNIFGPKTNYSLTNFTVPSGANSDYVGTFKYNKNDNTYTYYNTKVTNNVVYYDVKKIYEVNNPDENTINTLFNVAFIEIKNDKYNLYSDYNYTNKISSGNFTNFEDIANMLSKLNTNKYQYTFRKDTCNYDSYCFYEGKWLNG